jgi:uncharacterized protein YegL
MWSTLAFASALSSAAVAQEPDDSHSAVVIILDGSGSMTEIFHGVSRMDAAKSALKTVLKTLPNDTELGLLVFASQQGGQDGPWAYPLGARQDNVLMPAIDRVSPGGRTPLGEYIKYGADALLENRDRNLGYGTYRLLVVTDGQASDSSKMELFAPEVVDRGIVLDVIGVDMERSHTLKQMATSYRAADRPEELEEAVREVLAEVSFGADATADAELFATLEGLPDGFAMATIESLTSGTQNNHPIGYVPKPPELPESPASSSSPRSPSASRSSGGCSTVLAASGLASALVLPALVARRRR